MHWPAPITRMTIEHDRGPVLVTVEYRIRPHDREAFLAAIAKLAHERRRDGAYRWGVFEDAAEAAASSRRFWSIPGLSICASTSASPTPTAWSRRRCSDSTSVARPRSPT